MICGCKTSVCRRYDEIVDRIMSRPSSTEELVSLIQYMKHTSDVTVYKLRHETEEAARRLFFLLDFVTLTRTNLLLLSSQIIINARMHPDK